MTIKTVLIITGVSTVSFAAGLIVTMEYLKFTLKREATEMKKQRTEDDSRRGNFRCYNDTYKR